MVNSSGIRNVLQYFTIKFFAIESLDWRHTVIRPRFEIPTVTDSKDDSFVK